jgi:hypothetical protein
LCFSGFTTGFAVSLMKAVQLFSGCKFFLLIIGPVNRGRISGWVNAQYFPTIHSVIVQQ